MSRASRFWAHLRRRRRQWVGAALALALLYGYLAGLLYTVAMAGESEDPAAPAAMIALFIAGLWFLEAYVVRAIQMLLSLPWFNRVFPEPEVTE